MALAGAAAMTIGTVFTQEADAAARCRQYEFGIGCVENLSATVERIGVKFNNGRWMVADVTCTGEQWILHSGWQGTQSKAQVSEFVEGYCEARGSMF